MNGPARLDKVDKSDNEFMDWINEHINIDLEAWVLSHAYLCLIVLICLLMSLFVVLMFTLVGVSATESGVMYNKFDKLI